MALVVASTAPAFAQAGVNPNEPDPAVWLRSVYDLYVRAEKDQKLQRVANYRLVVKRSSKSLATLFRKNDQCEKRGGGICAIDFDFLVNGQDNQLSDISIADMVANGDKATVAAAFKNMKTPNRNVYFFVREGGVWKIDDVEMKTGTEKPFRLAAMLRDYKP